MAIDTLTTVTDGVDDVLAAYHNQLVVALNKVMLSTAYAGYETRTAASGTITLTDNSYPIQSIDCNGANRTVNLPASAATNHLFMIANTTASGLYALTISGLSIVLYPGQSVTLVPSAFYGWKIYSIGGASSKVQVRRAATQSISNTTFTDISNDTLVFDNAGFYSAGSPTLLTVPITAWYTIYVYASWANNGTGYRSIRVLNTGSVVMEYKTPAVSGDVTSFAFSVMEKITAGNQLKIDAYQNSGGALTITTKMSIKFESL